MNIVKAYSKGLLDASRWPKMLLILFVSNLLLGLAVALPINTLMYSESIHSMEISNLLKNYDFSTLQDLTRSFGSAYAALKSQVIWIGIIYFLINVFLVGGILQTVSLRTFSVNNFFGGSGRYFFRFLFVNLISILHQVLVAVLVGVSVSLIFIFFKSQIHTEPVIYGILGGAILLWAFLAISVLMINDYAKNFMVYKQSINVFWAFFKGFQFVFRHGTKTMIFSLLLYAAPVGVYALYFIADSKITAPGPIGVLLALLLTQAFIMSRIWFRIWILAGQYTMYIDDYEKDIIRIAQQKALKAKKAQEALIAKEARKQNANKINDSKAVAAAELAKEPSMPEPIKEQS